MPLPGARSPRRCWPLHELRVIPVEGLPEIAEGDDLGILILSVAVIAVMVAMGIRRGGQGWEASWLAPGFSSVGSRDECPRVRRNTTDMRPATRA